MLKFDFKMAVLRCFSAIKINLHVLQCILCGQNIMVDRFLRNSGYLVAREVFSTFGCQFPSKRRLEKSKNTKVCLNLTLKWQHEMLFCYKINLHVVQCILCSQNILADRFLRNSGYLVEREVLSSFGCQFPSKRRFEKSKNTKVCLNLTLKWQHWDAFLP